MGDQLAGFDEWVRAAGGLAFAVLLVVVAVQYRRRLRDIRKLRESNGLLSRQLAAALERLRVYETLRPELRPRGSVWSGSGWDGLEKPRVSEGSE
jgi:hypothetical protein